MAPKHPRFNPFWQLIVVIVSGNSESKTKKVLTTKILTQRLVSLSWWGERGRRVLAIGLLDQSEG
ncbi:unnamed protein product [Dovyalis caffra]|uniref:Uncharacterized protein n=1 Tax=Dovyalis caffra TaxID=77055 RepID=A0AAV1S8F4_9ROSI|nr:unnamed protein product [Dovyalis caffra]